MKHAKGQGHEGKCDVITKKARDEEIGEKKYRR